MYSRVLLCGEVCLLVYCCVSLSLSLCALTFPGGCMYLQCPQHLFPSPAHICLQPGILFPRGLQAWSWLPYPLDPKAAFVHCPWPKPGEASTEASTGHRLKQCYRRPQRSPEAVRTSQSPVRAASYLVPAGARECHLIVRTIVTMSWAVGGPERPRVMGLLSLVDLYRSLPQWHPGGQHTLPAFCLPTPTP